MSSDPRGRRASTIPVTKRALDVIYLCTSKSRSMPSCSEMTKLSNTSEQKIIPSGPVGDKEMSNSERPQERPQRTLLFPERRKTLGSEQGSRQGRRDVAERTGQAAATVWAKPLGCGQLPRSVISSTSRTQGPHQLVDRLDELTPSRRQSQGRDDMSWRRLRPSASPGKQPLMPWHDQRPFFPGSAAVFRPTLQNLRTQDLVKRARFLPLIVLPNRPGIERTNNDFAPQKGKNPARLLHRPHGATASTVRVLRQRRPHDYWMSTMLHEFGHSVYTASISTPSCPTFCGRNPHSPHHRRRAMISRKLKASVLAGGDDLKGGQPEDFDDTAPRCLRDRS